MTGESGPGTPAAVDLRLLVPALVGWAAVAVAFPLPGGVTAAVLIGCAVIGGVGSVVLFRRRDRGLLTVRRWFGLGCASALVVASLLGCALADAAIHRAGAVVELAEQRAVVEVTGTIDGDPRTITGRPARAGPLVIVPVGVLTIAGRGGIGDSQARLLVFGDAAWQSLQRGTTVGFVGRLGPAQDPSSVEAVVDPRGPPRVLAEPGPADRVAEYVRAGLRDAAAGLPKDAAGLLPGLVLGDTSVADASLTDDMKATGLTHLAAVSGTNVTMVLHALWWCCGLFRVPRRWRVVFAGAGLVGFVILVRPEPSVLRAAAMGSVGLVSLVSSRPRTAVPALATAIVGLLAYSPPLARSLGFALSVLATLGLLLWARPWADRLATRLPRRLGLLAPAITVPVAAQVMCLPILVTLQGGISWVSVPANIAAAPFVGPATIMGVVTAVIAAGMPGLAAVLVWGAGLPTMAVALVARIGADVPGGVLPWPGGPLGVIGSILLVVTLLTSGPWLLARSRARPLVAAAGVVLTLAAVVPVHELAWPMTNWRLVACDVGQGDALVVRTGSAVVVVDAGPDPKLVDACLRRLHVERVDAIVLTHFHADHIDGLAGALAGRDVGAIVTSWVAEPPADAQRVREVAERAGVPVTSVRAGDHLAFGDTAWRVWWPARRIDEGSVPNNSSIVVSVETAGLRALLLGDIEREAARALLTELQQAGAGAFDVVKVAHHGSANRLDALYAYAAAPVAIISVGAGNDYGHPAASTVAMLRGLGARVLRTDESGDIAVRPAPEDPAGENAAGSAGEGAPGHRAMEVACRGP